MTKWNSSALAVLGALLAPSFAFANTYIVDSSGGAGSNFLDIPPAIAFAAPGDVLLVRPGHYSGFTLNKALAIVGEGGGVVLNGGAIVQSIGAGQIASLVSLALPSNSSVQVLNCPGTVIGDSLTLPMSNSVSGSSDVRLRLVHPGNGIAALHVTGSRVELVESSLHGPNGYDWFCGDPVPTPVPAVDAASGVVHVARCNLTGGLGGDSNCDSPKKCQRAENGSDALRLGSTAVGLVTGVAAQVLIGGAGGTCLCGNADGQPGYGLYLLGGAQARYSGATISSIHNGGGTLEMATPSDPSMKILEVPVQGGNLSFRVNAPVGSHVVLNMGRRPIVQHVTGLQEDVLVQTINSYDLGIVPAQGSVSLLFHIPIGWIPGTTRFFQAVATLPNLEQRRTHSIPIVVR